MNNHDHSRWIDPDLFLQAYPTGCPPRPGGWTQGGWVCTGVFLQGGVPVPIWARPPDKPPGYKPTAADKMPLVDPSYCGAWANLCADLAEACGAREDAVAHGMWTWTFVAVQPVPDADPPSVQSVWHLRYNPFDPKAVLDAGRQIPIFEVLLAGEIRDPRRALVLAKAYRMHVLRDMAARDAVAKGVGRPPEA
jgi:hypothetical protein